MVEKIQNIQDLRVEVQSILVKDYGDFKRKLVLYLNRYKESHPLTMDEKKIFIEMIDKIQFHPTQDIESTRGWVLNKLQSFRS